MKKAAIRIYCASDCRQNRGIISEAITRLTEEGLGSRVHFNDVSSGIGNGSLLVIDGNHEKHNWEKLRSLNIEPDFHLVVTDLGLETVDDEFLSGLFNFEFDLISLVFLSSVHGWIIDVIDWKKNGS